MSEERRRYVVTVPSCSCDAESAYVHLTAAEVALLVRVDRALDKYGGAISVTAAERAEGDRWLTTPPSSTPPSCTSSRRT